MDKVKRQKYQVLPRGNPCQTNQKISGRAHNGRWITDPTELGHLVSDYFKNIFQTVMGGGRCNYPNIELLIYLKE